MKKKLTIRYLSAGLFIIVCTSGSGTKALDAKNPLKDNCKLLKLSGPEFVFSDNKTANEKLVKSAPEELFDLNNVNPDRLFFSEYIEGTSNNKALEIFNPGNEPVELKNYRISQSVNGNGWRHFHTFPEDALIQPKSVWIVVHNKTSVELFDTTGRAQLESISTSVVTYNGNDARGLMRIQDGDTTLVDVIGIADEDPGNGWFVGGIKDATMNSTLIRKPRIQTGNPDWESSAGTNEDDSEWIVKPVDDFSDLGSHSYDPDNTTSITHLAGTGTIFKIYPNPASDMLFFESKIIDCSITITDITGKQFKQIHHTGNQSLIDISGLNNGLYVMHIKYQGGSGVRRFVKVGRR